MWFVVEKSPKDEGISLTKSDSRPPRSKSGMHEPIFKHPGDLAYERTMKPLIETAQQIRSGSMPSKDPNILAKCQINIAMLLSPSLQMVN